MNFKKGEKVRWIHQKKRIAVVVREGYRGVNPELIFIDNYEFTSIHPSQLERAAEIQGSPAEQSGEAPKQQLKPKMPSKEQLIKYCADLDLPLSIGCVDKIYEYFARHFGH